MLLRRIHLYAGLFLLPWVFLYGITGAMYNHQGLFSEASISYVHSEQLASSPLAKVGTANELAQAVVDALAQAAPQHTIVLTDDHRPEFTNDISFEVEATNGKHHVHIDPVQKRAWVATHATNSETPQPALKDVNHISLESDPHIWAMQSVDQILSEAGLVAAGKPRALGWSKLNFLVEINGQPARVTYVLRDGHVDVTHYTQQDGMTPRQFFLRMHTTHGQPPQWNGRRFWSLLVDAMAIAMVSWGTTGLVMWWQIKRTRRIGFVVLAASFGTAAMMYFVMQNFYASNVL